MGLGKVCGIKRRYDKIFKNICGNFCKRSIGFKKRRKKPLAIYKITRGLIQWFIKKKGGEMNDKKKKERAR